MKQATVPLVVSIIGRPNVGKSTLFNRLIKKPQKVITMDMPGVTRDRHYEIAKLEDGAGEEVSFVLVDTGGFYEEKIRVEAPHVPGQDKGKKEKNRENMAVFFNTMIEHAHMAIDQADLVLLVVDAKDGLLDVDKAIYQAIRKKEKNYLVVVNKADTDLAVNSAYEFLKMGMEEKDIVSVSAAHGRGIKDFEDVLINHLKNIQRNLTNASIPQSLMPKHEVLGTITILGAPNAGKSTLLNAFLKEERSLVTEIAGTTVDPIEGYIDIHGDKTYSIRLIDTAGIRRKKNIDQSLEEITVVKALQAIEMSDVVILLVDAGVGLTHQDRRLSEIVLEKGKSLMICLNKMDLYPEALQDPKHKKRYFEQIQAEIPWNFCKVSYCSAKEKLHLNTLKRDILKTLMIRKVKISTGQLNQVLQNLNDVKPLIIKGTNRRFNIKYATVIKMDPPTFIIFTNLTRDIPEHYRRYLANGVRNAFKLVNAPVHLVFRKKTPEDIQQRIDQTKHLG